jgi:MFS family permease
MSENTTQAELPNDHPSHQELTAGAVVAPGSGLLNTSDPMNTPLQEYHWYMGGQAMFFGAGGIGFVLGQWIIAFYLREPPEVMGLAMMTMSLPQLLFILFGGLAADRLELRSHLVRMQFLMMIPMLAVAIVIMIGELTIVILVIINFIGAIFGAFVQPARDSLLSRVTVNLEHISIQQAITTANMLQFGAQIFGILLVMAVAFVGPVSLIFVQSFLYLMGIYATTRLSVSPAPVQEKSDDHWIKSMASELADGLKISFGSSEIRPVMLWVLSSGFIVMGTFMIYLPLIVRDVFHGDAFELTVMMTCFFSGVTICSRLLSRFGSFKYQGRALLIAQTVSALIMLSVSQNNYLWVFFVLVFCWGLSAAVSMSMTRSIIQQAAPESHRARILSVFLLCMFGGSPVGSLIGGYLAKNYGPLDAMLISMVASLTMILAFTVFSSLWIMKARPITFDEAEAA